MYMCLHQPRHCNAICYDKCTAVWFPPRLDSVWGYDRGYFLCKHVMLQLSSAPSVCQITETRSTFQSLENVELMSCMQNKSEVKSDWSPECTSEMLVYDQTESDMCYIASARRIIQSVINQSTSRLHFSSHQILTDFTDHITCWSVRTVKAIARQLFELEE